MTEKKHRYILVRYAMKPRDPKATSNAGYVKDPQNVRWDEQVSLRVGVKTKDISTYDIVVDIDGQKVVKNRLSPETDWASIMDYFMKAYERQIIDFMQKTSG